MWAKQKQSGFTIVELLIVIVVIAVLAAISIVAYNGIQDRTRISKIAATVTAYRKALIQYATVNGTYPVNSNAYQCLGEGYTGGVCWNGNASEWTAWNNLLRPYMGNATPLPTVDTAAVGNFTGAMFVNHTHASVTLDGQQYRYYIWYVIPGAGAKCPVGPVLTGNWSTFTSAEPVSGYTFISGTSGSQCWIKMPDPTTL